MNPQPLHQARNVNKNAGEYRQKIKYEFEKHPDLSASTSSWFRLLEIYLRHNYC